MVSVVSNVLMQFSGADGDEYAGREFGTDFDNLARVQELAREFGGGTFKEITAQPNGNAWGGSKYPECTLLGAAFNGLSLADFIDGLEKLEWREPKLFRLFVQGQQSDAFGVWVIRDGKIVCVVEEAGF